MLQTSFKCIIFNEKAITLTNDEWVHYNGISSGPFY